MNANLEQIIELIPEEFQEHLEDVEFAIGETTIDAESVWLSRVEGGRVVVNLRENRRLSCED